jgi:hypothetical protein
VESQREVDAWVVEGIAPLRGQTVGFDAMTLEANAVR